MRMRSMDLSSPAGAIRLGAAAASVRWPIVVTCMGPGADLLALARVVAPVLQAIRAAAVDIVPYRVLSATIQGGATDQNERDGRCRAASTHAPHHSASPPGERASPLRATGRTCRRHRCR